MKISLQGNSCFKLQNQYKNFIKRKKKRTVSGLRIRTEEGSEYRKLVYIIKKKLWDCNIKYPRQNMNNLYCVQNKFINYFFLSLLFKLTPVVRCYKLLNKVVGTSLHNIQTHTFI